MPIENRDLPAGTRLAVRHKRQEHTCEVVKTKDGLRYRLKDGKEFNSPSSAGREITGGVAVNGWRFWSLEGTLPERKANAEKKATSPKPATKKPPAKKAAKGKGKKPAKKKVAKAASKGDSFGCGVCGATFKTMSTATKHTRTHVAQ